MQFAAKKLDKRLADLGAVPIVEKGLGDDQHPSGYDYSEITDGKIYDSLHRIFTLHVLLVFLCCNNID